MTEQEILSELKAIRSLLALDKEERLQKMLDDLDEKHERVLEELSFTDWKTSEEFKGTLAEELDTSKRTIKRKLDDLASMQLVESRGEYSGTEYRKSGMLKAIDEIL